MAATILGLGNPLLDISAHVPKQLLDKYGLKPNDAILAGETHMPLYDELENSYQPVTYVAGGATQNSIRVAQWMMQRPHATAYIGAVGKQCRRGHVLKQAAEQDGVKTLYYEVDGAVTGTCAVLIHAQDRSLVANLAAANLMDPQHLDSPQVQTAMNAARIFYSAGFFLTHSAGPIMSKRVAQHASSKGKIYALNLSAPFIVNFFHTQLMELIPYADFVFANEVEARAFGDKMGWTTAAEDQNNADLEMVALQLANMPRANVHSRSRVVVFTQGSNHTIMANGDSVTTHAVNPLDASLIVDTNGAGDAFVGGFLAGLALNQSLSTCVQAGHAAARIIIQQTGCTLPTSGPPSSIFPSPTTMPRMVIIRTATYSKYAVTESVSVVSKPIMARFKVAKGFGRGGKQLGVPTANVPAEVVDKVVSSDQMGVFFGWAKLRGTTYKAVASIGYNPFFKNDTKTIEPHLLDFFGPDFYDEEMNLVLCGYIRPERNYGSLLELKEAIMIDIETARAALMLNEWKKFAEVVMT